uniref:Secreted protein n=1 Tax=Setaria viridis TaxID=4556 RepID=A0A4U6UZK8_SETVI|nr:hypothetical protein SEVIR_4G211001v2 [Setaria viridis]
MSRGLLLLFGRFVNTVMLKRELASPCGVCGLNENFAVSYCTIKSINCGLANICDSVAIWTLHICPKKLSCRCLSSVCPTVYSFISLALALRSNIVNKFSVVCIRTLADYS